jgi:hypothetical protein
MPGQGGQSRARYPACYQDAAVPRWAVTALMSAVVGLESARYRTGTMDRVEFCFVHWQISAQL